MTLKQEKLLQEAKTASLLVGLSSLVSKILAAIYRIPYQNLVGDRGFYAYQQIYPFLAIITALGLTGFPNLISSLLQKSSSRHLVSFLKLSTIFSWVTASLMLLGHQILANWIGASRLGPAFIWVAATFFITPFLSFYRGIDQGQGKLRVTALSQVVEQVVRVLIIIVAAACYLVYRWDIYQTANLAASGNFFASLVTVVYLAYQSKENPLPLLAQRGMSLAELGSAAIPSLVFTLYAMYLLLFQLIDAFLVKNILVEQGMANQLAEALKGVYDRGQPLLQFGLLVTTALFTSYLPKLTQLYLANEKTYELERQRFFEVIFYLSLTITVGFLSVLPQVNQVLFTDRQGLLALSLYSSLIFLASMVQYFHHHCFIVGQHRSSLLYLFLGVLLKLLITGPLTGFFGIVGSSLSTCLSLVFVLLAYVRQVPVNWANLVNGKFYLVLSIMGLLVFGLTQFLPQDSRIWAFMSLLLSTGLGGGIFLLLSYHWQVFPDSLWSFLPFFHKK
ncbi:oligosaccharide flippase family protein [Streptococcus cuniculipharyngis]|uniref:oligosaccharide flippase family protein n=1 Tax=Streptococcus cuniculipharyngis TaxID=1562651 RepID=UPI001647D5B8|nr:oligosaccharide flippase family protein [Streptococcus cuniculipharyngis]